MKTSARHSFALRPFSASLSSAMMILLVGCSGSESPEDTPTSTPTPASTSPSPDVLTPTATPGGSTASPTVSPTASPTVSPTAIPESTPTATPEGVSTSTPESTPPQTPGPTPTSEPLITPTLPPEGPAGPYPLIFVTQVPYEGYASISSPFSNHKGGIDSAPRGGDLWIRYPDGTLRNLTQEAGFGDEGQQGANAIAVREPCVHWDGKKAVFAMVVGAPTKQYQLTTFFWQLYEVTGLEQGQKAVLTKVAHQPTSYNNVAPIYGTDDRIIFTSDRPRNGQAHLHPQLDEYESEDTLTGLWSLDPSSGMLNILTHTPSGAFNPTLDSFGRVIFTQWDHLQRDQQADSNNAQATYKPINYPSEAKDAVAGPYAPEVFPESRNEVVGNENKHSFNQFFPWMVHEDGSEHETLNHVGRQEIGGTYTDGSFNDDPNLSYYTSPSLHLNVNMLYSSAGLFNLREDPLTPGLYFASYLQEFADGRAGQVVTLSGPPDLNPEEMILSWITSPSTRSQLSDSETPPEDHSGQYRNPVPLSDGTVLVSHTDEVTEDKNDGSTANPQWRYDFRLKSLEHDGDYWVAGNPLIEGDGIVEAVSWYSPDVLVSYHGPLWELDPMEVRVRARPARLTAPLKAPEAEILAQEGVDEAALRSWLKANNLAIIVSRDVTLRDRADVQQPYNLRVPDGVSNIAKSGKVYDVSAMQIFQGDLLRAYASGSFVGRRVVPVPLHEDGERNPPLTNAPAGSVLLGKDGSMAAFVPAGRALSWQLLDPSGKPVVRERNWLSFAPGEIRACPSCHGINTLSQTGEPEPENPPQALKALLKHWKTFEDVP